MNERPGPAFVYRRVLETYVSEARFLLPLAAVVFVPLGLLDGAADAAEEIDADEIGDLEAAALVGALAAGTVTALLGDVFYSGAVAALIAKTPPGATPSLRGIARTLPYWRLAAVDVLFSIGATLTLLLLVIPGLVFLTWFSLSAPVVEIEDRGVWAAFRRSRRLVRGRFWTVFWVLIPISLVSEALTEAAQLATSAALGESLISDWLGGSVADIVLTPIFAVAAVVLTLELIEAKREGAEGSAPQR